LERTARGLFVGSVNKHINFNNRTQTLPTGQNSSSRSQALSPTLSQWERGKNFDFDIAQHFLCKAAPRRNREKKQIGTMSKRPTASAAIITGCGMLGFALLYFLTGIFPSRQGGLFSLRRWGAVTATENPLRFGYAIFATCAIGVASLIWGLLKMMKR
jgi:hypothetical protein